jgi:lysozyme family protein
MEMAQSIAALVDAVITREGGYVNHLADRGGPTCWGITEAVARAHGYRGAMPALPRAAAAAIYERVYWTKPRLDRVALRTPTLAAELFDTGINMGVGVAVGFLQRALNALNRGGSDYPDLRVDRRIGPATLHALDSYCAVRADGERTLIKAVDALQGERYIALTESRPANEAFVHGWLTHRLGQD